jgi:hypothetical protein
MLKSDREQFEKIDEMHIARTPFDIVKALARDKGIPISRLERELGFGSNSFYRWKKHDPSSSKAKIVADYFGVSVDYILGNGIDREQPTNQLLDISDEQALIFFKGREITKKERNLIIAILDMTENQATTNVIRELSDKRPSVRVTPENFDEVFGDDYEKQKEDKS